MVSVIFAILISLQVNAQSRWGGSAPCKWGTGTTGMCYAEQITNLKCVNDPSVAEVNQDRTRFTGAGFQGAQLGLAVGLLNRVRALGGGKHIESLKVKVFNGLRPGADTCSAYTKSNEIELPNNCSARRGEATIRVLAHEMGHFTALNGGFYDSYLALTKAKGHCHATGYCRMHSTTGGRASPISEEFAESYSLFVLAPDVLKKHCAAAYEFMRDSVFTRPQPGAQANACAADPTNRIKMLTDYGSSGDSFSTNNNAGSPSPRGSSPAMDSMEGIGSIFQQLFQGLMSQPVTQEYYQSEMLRDDYYYGAPEGAAMPEQGMPQGTTPLTETPQ